MIDFHTHSANPFVEHSFINQGINEEIGTEKFCLGIHPWEAESRDFTLFVKLLHQVIHHPHFCALGEIGLDKLKGPNFKLQESIFAQQVKLAIELGIDLIVLHSVKSHNECFNHLRNNGYKGKLLIHDYHGPIDVYESFSREWETYISVSKRFLTLEKNYSLIRKLGTFKVLLETDEHPHNSIRDSYQKLSEILNMKVSLIEKHHQEIFYSLLKR